MSGLGRMLFVLAVGAVTTVSSATVRSFPNFDYGEYTARARKQKKQTAIVEKLCSCSAPYKVKNKNVKKCFDWITCGIEAGLVVD